VTYPIGQLSVTGTLETLVINGGQAQPIPGETVSLSLVYDGYKVTPLGSFVTDQNGQVSTTTTALSPGAIEAAFAGDGTYNRANGGAPVIAASLLPTRITVGPITPVPYRATASVTATVSMQLPDGSWVPAPNSLIRIDGDGCELGPPPWSGTTDAAGQWTAQLPAVPPDPAMNSFCDFYSQGDEAGESWTKSVLSPAFVIPLSTFPTGFGSFNVCNGATPILGDIEVCGSAQWRDSAGRPHPYGGATVRLYFSYAGTGTPQLMATAVTGKSGAFTFPRLSGYLKGGRLAAGTWEVRLPANGKYLAGMSDWVLSGLTVPASYSKVKLTGHGRTWHLTGTLLMPKGRPLHGVRVTVLYNTGKLHRGATVTTSAKGTFSIPLAAPEHSMRIKYAASFAGLSGKVPAWLGADGYVKVSPAVSPWLWLRWP
jgi:hypothetical protein